MPWAGDDRQLLSVGPVRLRHRPVPPTGPPAGVVVEVVPSAAVTALAVPASRGGPAHGAERTFVGLAGTSPSWRSTCAALRGAAAAGVPTLVVGEPGVGKTAAVVSAHRERHPAGRCVLVDARDDGAVEAVRTERLGADTAVVVRHGEALGSPAVLADLVEAGAPWVVALVSGTEADPALPEVLGAPVLVEPLRRRAEDVAVLVPVLLERFAANGGPSASSRRPRVSAAAGQLLGGGLWPGNVAELETVLRGALAASRAAGRAGEIELEDLPPELGVHGTRRRLSPLEAAERDLIVTALIEAHGNRVHAAKALGMGRATLYRRLRAFGITEVGR